MRPLLERMGSAGLSRLLLFRRNTYAEHCRKYEPVTNLPAVCSMNPIEFSPILKRACWGGRRLNTILGKKIGSHQDYAETWEICDLGETQSVVLSGSYAGWTLNRLVREVPELLFGTENSHSQFPLLVKFLDCDDRHSVQVHPDDRQVHKYYQNEKGKTEAWFVISAEPGSFIYAGLKDGVTPELLQASLENGTVEDCMHRITPLPGECYYIPAGTVHMLGGGILVAEVQQPSDVTFRLFDWNRTDAQGNCRPLHVDQALECIDFQRGPIQPVEPTLLHQDENAELNQLIDSPFFRIDRLSIQGEFLLPSDSTCKVIMSVSGKGTMRTGGASCSLPIGKTYLIPATCDDLHFESEGDIPNNILIASPA